MNYKISHEQDNPNRAIYNSNYGSANLELFSNKTTPYTRELIKIRLELIDKYGKNKNVIDLCCGTGEYLLKTTEIFDRGIGVDFSYNLLAHFDREAKQRNETKIDVVLSDARSVALKSELAELIFSFTSLYHIPQVEIVIKEAARLLRPGGIAILELGNRFSLNTVVSNTSYRRRETAKPFHISYKEMKKAIENTGLTIIEHRCFQILPMWAAGSKVLALLALPFFRSFLSIKVADRMIDEWISGTFPFRYFAFRHLFICLKT